MQKEINELLQERIKNEKKQKNITTITAILFCLFSMIIIGLANLSYEQKKIIEDQKKELEIAKTQDSLTLNRTADIYEKQADKIANELNEKEKTNGVSKSIASETSDTIIYNYKINHTHSSPNKNYTIYIQYMENFSQQASMLKTAFIKDYIVPKGQNMKNLSFPSSVRYFYEKDEKRAEQIAKKAEEITNKQFIVQPIKIKSPKNQIEIWIGR